MDIPDDLSEEAAVDLFVRAFKHDNGRGLSESVALAAIRESRKRTSCLP